MLFGNAATAMFQTNVYQEKFDYKPLFDILLYRDYPLKNIGLTLGNTYTVYEEYSVIKRVTQDANLAIEIWLVKNDDNKLIHVSPHFFKQLNTN